MVKLNLLDVLFKISNLKKIKRTGWAREGVPNPETVAEHIWRVSFLSLVLAPKNLEMEKLLKMAVIHDITEALVGDIVWARGTKVHRDIKAEKEKAEKKAMETLCSGLGNGKELLDIWQDFISQTSKEARFLKEIEKIDLVLKAHEYESAHKVDLSEFYENAKMYLRDPKLLDLYNKVIALRNKRLKKRK